MTNPASPTIAQRQTRLLRVSTIREEATGIRSFELVDPEDSPLPSFTAGANIHVHIDENNTRQYSLCSNPGENQRYEIAVLREPESRGGSIWMHEQVKTGDLIAISGPDNHFPLATRGVKHHLMFSGGIGITPMMAMMGALDASGQLYTLHYCTRSRETTAFLDRLEDRISDGRVVLHHDGGDPEKSLDIAATIGQYRVGAHLYACGPSGFMKAVNDAVMSWPPHVVHQEYFAARELTEEEKYWDSVPFTADLKRSGKAVQVKAGQSLADALQDQGIPVLTDCKEGYCGTCITRYLDGDPVHRDSVLDETGRAEYVMVCCARSRDEILVLDI